MKRTREKNDFHERNPVNRYTVNPDWLFRRSPRFSFTPSMLSFTRALARVLRGLCDSREECLWVHRDPIVGRCRNSLASTCAFTSVEGVTVGASPRGTLRNIRLPPFLVTHSVTRFVNDEFRA